VILGIGLHFEIFGMPSRVYFFDPNIPGNYETVKKQAKETGSNAWAVLPIGSDMKQESGGGKQGSDNFKLLAEFCNAEMSKAMLGQTMTTESGSSYSQSKVHGETEDDINHADRRFVERVLNEKFIPLLISQGFSIPEKEDFTPLNRKKNWTKSNSLKLTSSYINR
jgi:phage gp29-like protein